MFAQTAQLLAEMPITRSKNNVPALLHQEEFILITFWLKKTFKICNKLFFIGNYHYES